jgi:hypothetical protein
MRIPTWRLALTGGAVIMLAAAGIGLVAAADTPSKAPAGIAAAAPTTAPGSTVAPQRVRARGQLDDRAAGGARLLRLGRRIVHVEATVTDRDSKLITIWLDHGTVQSVGSGSVTVSESGGASRQLKTDTATIVHLGKEDATLADVTAGDEVFVQSRVDGGSALARRILIIPARPS